MKNKINLHFLFVLIAAAFWGAAGVFVKSAVSLGIKEMQIVFFRALLSALIYAAFIFFKNKSLFKIALKDLWLFISTGLFSIVLFNFSYYKTMSLTTLSVAAVLLYTAPFFVFILSVPLFKEKVTHVKISALLSAFLGCCFVSGVFWGNQRISFTALVFGLLTGFGYSLYTIFSQILINKKYHSLTITFYAFLSAAVGTLPFISIPKTFSAVIVAPKILWVMFLMALLNTVIPYLLYTKGLTGVSTTAAPIIATIEPVVATVISIMYGEAFKVWHLIGIILVLSSVLILNLGGKKNEN